MILALLFSCTPQDTTPTPIKPTPVVDELEIPDITGIDMEKAFEDALALALTVNARTPFNSLSSSFDRFQTGCPDVYAGPPGEDQAPDLDIDMDAGGLSWADHCINPDGTTFSGYGWWNGEIAVTGDPNADLTIEAEREMIADGVVGGADGVFFEFDGEASDSLYNVTSNDGYVRWVYSSLVEGTTTGTDPFPSGALAPYGWRTDLYVRMTGGNEDSLETRGNVYLFTGRMNERFDSLALDINVIGELGAGPDDCTQEPLGWIGLRDENAVWYDLIFLPRSEDDITGIPYPNDPLSECDGCGTLYIRGVESGEFCPDFSFLFDGTLQPPPVDEFVSSLRDLP
ncbi:MAG: hypothetical protein H6737_02065 [Alphaproteobacteria bacterium]|nr:hypothetical protein [Alphaproteobacteria bacterium]